MTRIMKKDDEELIEVVRKEIKELQEQQNTIFHQMICITRATNEEEEWLWEYCFNCGDEGDYTKFVKGKLNL